MNFLFAQHSRGIVEWMYSDIQSSENRQVFRKVTYTWVTSSSAASGSIRENIIGPTVSSFSALLFPAFQSWNILTPLQPITHSLSYLRCHLQGVWFNLPFHLCKWGRAERLHSETQRGDDTSASSRPANVPSSSWWSPLQTYLSTSEIKHMLRGAHGSLCQVWQVKQVLLRNGIELYKVYKGFPVN